MQAILAISNNNVIGKGIGLAWHMKEDLQHFRAMTLDKDVIVGTTTLLGLPNLPRRNVVQLSRNRKLATANDICYSPEAAFQKYPLGIVIGGAKVIEAMLPYVNRLIITHVNIDIPQADDLVYFNLPKGYKVDKEYKLSERAIVREYVKC